MENNPLDNNSVNAPSKSFSILSHGLEFASIITLITAVLYFIGYGYYDSFFSRLSVPHKDLGLPLIFYFQGMWWIWLFGILCVSISFLRAKEPPTTYYDIVIGNSVLIMTSFIGIIWLLPKLFVKDTSLIASEGLIGFILVIFFSTIYAFKQKWSLAHFFYRSDLKVQLMLIGVFIIVVYIIATVLGSLHATMLLAGVNPDSKEITLELKETNNDVNSKSFILVLHHNGNYYLVEKNVSAPESPILYIVPDDQVKMAKIRINKNT